MVDTEVADGGSENNSQTGANGTEPDDQVQDDGDRVPADQDQQRPSKQRKVHKLSYTKTTDFNEQLKKRGVIYIARIPPRMTPTKLKALMEDFGVTRIYLVEEDASVRKRRRKLTGNASKRYKEGWIEFESKKVAKHVAANMNNTPMSGQKRSHHHDDLWNLKYLSKFQWSHLTEKVAYERRVREQKLRLETMQARRETASYKHLVETGKKVDRIEARKRKRAAKDGNSIETDNDVKLQNTRRPPQTQPIDESSRKPSKRALLGSLV